jgi:hypothetical protein
MNTYQDIPPQERMVFIAKIYHNIWYNNDRFAEIERLVNEWELNPTKEAKYLNQIHNGTDTTEIC